MINGLEGIPGSGKSYEASVFQVLEALKQGRKVITNLPLEVEAYCAIDPGYRSLLELRYVPAPIRGTWDPARMNPETGEGNAFELFPDGQVVPAPESVTAFGHVWDYYSEWRHPKTKQGPLYVIDECHVPMPKLGTDKAVVQWYKLSRHFGADVLLMTQKFREMCPDIAGIMAMVIKVRKADVLGKPQSYIRKVHAGYRGAVIQEGVRDYQPEFFKLYRSHTQGNAVLEAGATDVAPVSVKLKRWTKGVWLLSAASIAFAWWVIARDKPVKGNPTGSVVVKADGKTDMKALEAFYESPKGKGAPAPKNAPDADPGEPKGDPEPYGGKGLHLTGPLRKAGRMLYTFAVSSSGSVIAAVTSEDLTTAGYQWEPKTDCFGYLRWQGKAKAITCDAPARQVGTPDRPLVLRDGYGSDGRVPGGGGGGMVAPGNGPALVVMDGSGAYDPQGFKSSRGH